MVHNGPGQQLNNSILYRAGEGEAKQDVLFHHRACGSWETDVPLFSESVSQPQPRAQRELLVSLSQGTPCRHRISQHFQPSLTCSGSESWWKPSFPQRSSQWTPQLSNHPKAIHRCCALAVHDCNFLSTLLILLLGTYLVPYSYPSHWWHLCIRSPTLHISLPCHPKSSCPPTLWR